MKRLLPILTLLPLLLSSCEENVPSLSSKIPSLEKVEVVDNGGLVFELKCTCSNSFAVSECGFYVSEKPSMQDADKHPSKMTGDSFSAEVTLKGYSRKYYVCAFISNGRTEILSDSKIISISSLDNYVTFGTVGVDSYDRETGITTFSASCSVAEGVEVTGYGILWGDSSDLTTSGTSRELTFPASDAPVSFDLPDLRLGSQYYICQYLTYKDITVYGKTEKFNVYSLPAVTIGEVSAITASSAMVTGAVTDNGGVVLLEKGIVFAEGNVLPTVETGKVVSYEVSSDISVSLTDLSPNSEYTVRAYATNSEGMTYSSDSKTFRTLVALPSVSTGSATSVTSTSAILNATLVSDGGESPSECGFYWSDAQFTDPSAAAKVTSTLSGASFTTTLQNLKRSTTYYYQAYSRNSSGISYGEVKSFTTSAALPTVTTSSVSGITDVGATCGGTVTDDSGASITQRGVVWSTSPNPTVSLSTKTEDGPGNGSFTSSLTGLTRVTKYYVRAYAVNEIGVSYGDERTFITQASKATVTTLPATIVTPSSAELNASIDDDGGSSILEAGFYWSDVPFDEPSCATKIISSVSGTSIKAQLMNLASSTTYYYRAYAINSLGISYGEEITFTTMNDLSSVEPANCYIVSEAGKYSFKTVKGNSSDSVGNVSTCEVLWESFGTAATPSIGDLIKSLSYSDGYITFETASTFREGNAVIAAKDASGTILWSWHIWLTDQPKRQMYNNGAGVMMDRNLGATSATPGDVGALGLLYQWGRKDPFLNSSSISSSTEAESTITWPSEVSSSLSTGTIAFATSHPTTFIECNSNNFDWYYTSSSSTDNTRWQSFKTIHDPCPAGWRVPDGGSDGVWSKAFGTSSSWKTSSNWDYSNEGMDFSKTDKKLGSSGPIWYPASGDRSYSSGALNFVGRDGNYWSVSPYGNFASHLSFTSIGYVNPAENISRAYGRAVRCLQE